MQTLYANSIGMKNVLDLAVRYQSRVVQASTCVIYGPRPADGHLFKETNSADRISCLRVRVTTKGNVLPNPSVRPTAKFIRLTCALRVSFGPTVAHAALRRSDDSGFYYQFARREGTGTLWRRNVPHLTHLCLRRRGLNKLMQAPGDVKVVNLGSDLDLPLMDVAQRIIEMTGSTSKLTLRPPLLFMTQLGLPDLSYAKEKLGWIPLITLDDGLKRTIEYTMAHKSLLSFKSFGSSSA